MRPTLRRVAERAGVSEATVSRVLNDRPGVAATTRRAVQQAVEALGYSASGLRRQPAADAVGIIVPELDNPIFPAFAQAIEQQLARHGLLSLVCSSTLEGTAESDAIAMLVERGVVGIIIVSGLNADTAASHDQYRELVARGVALAFVNGPVEDLGVPCLGTDEAAAAATAVRHLADLGHREIGLAHGPARYVPTQRWLDGFVDAHVAVLGHEPPASHMIETVYSVEGGHVAMSRLLDAGVTGVLTGSDLMALGAIRCARVRDRRVPDDVSIIGYDDTPLVVFTDPPLTTLRQPVRAIAATLATLVVQQLSGASVTHHGEYLHRAELIVRRSSGPARTSATLA